MKLKPINATTHKISTNKGEYIAIVERLKNDINGNPRHQIIIICINDYLNTYKGVFKGYGNDKQEATNAVKVYEEERGKR